MLSYLHLLYIFSIDSDFLLNYETTLAKNHILGNDDSIFKEILNSKKKFAIAIISDCSYTPGARVRMALIQNLVESGLRIDTFGKCFSNVIENEELEIILHQYKFYFSYENSYHCKDYITEKFFDNPLTHGIVPVVWGATKDDYLSISPTGCLIFAEDFESPKHLIEHLEMLDENDEEYLKFFRSDHNDLKGITELIYKTRVLISIYVCNYYEKIDISTASLKVRGNITARYIAEFYVLMFDQYSTLKQVSVYR